MEVVTYSGGPECICDPYVSGDCCNAPIPQTLLCQVVGTSRLYRTCAPYSAAVLTWNGVDAWEGHGDIGACTQPEYSFGPPIQLGFDYRVYCSGDGFMYFEAAPNPQGLCWFLTRTAQLSDATCQPAHYDATFLSESHLGCIGIEGQGELYWVILEV